MARSTPGGDGERSHLACTRMAPVGASAGAPSHSTMSAPAMASRARATPIASISSSLVRSPAVSISTKGVPPIATGASSRSRVVPAMAEVIATSRSLNALIRLDFPIFGGPAMATRMPSRSRSADGRASQASIGPAIAAKAARKSSGATSASSEKSSDASTRAASASRARRQVSICRLSAPPASAIAARRCDSVSAWRRSASPSLSARSIRPFSKARHVNSPGCAARRPGRAPSAACTAATTARPP